MASPMPHQPASSWLGNNQQQQMQQRTQPTPPVESDDGVAQIRLMGLKVNYTVDRDAQANYLARHPQPLQVQTIPVDDRNSIGIADLRECAQCVANCSPELLSQDGDYAVYAYDYSEPDTPLVGQGMLSWILDSESTPEPKIVIGRVTKNMLAVFGGGGLRETLEVKFKLTPCARMQRPDSRPNFQRSGSHASFDASLQQSQQQQQQQQHPRPQDMAMTPTGSAEWNAFLQSNPQLGQHDNTSRVASPAPSQNRAEFPNPVAHRRDSFNHAAGSSAQIPPPHIMQQLQLQQHGEGPPRIAPTPVDPANNDASANPPSRPSSRTSTRSRKRQPTGRPRGRPRKTPAPETQGSTSGYEDGTDGDEGPAKKKRAIATQVAKNINDPFGSGPDSLRVAASTAGSIRTLRPTGLPGDVPQAGSHLQEVPRAPTPVPDGGPMRGRRPGKTAPGSMLRRQSTLSQSATAASSVENQPFCDLSFGMSPPSQDGRSPGDSEGGSPMYSEESPVPIGSSPPVPRATPFLQSSPPASSPILPPMPKPQPDSGFMSGDVDDLFEEPIKPLQLAPAAPQPPRRPKPKAPRSRDTSHIPIHVFDLGQAQVPSSDLDMTNNYHPIQPARPPVSNPEHPHTDAQYNYPPAAAQPVGQPRVAMPPPPPQQQMAHPRPQAQPGSNAPVTAEQNLAVERAATSESGTHQATQAQPPTQQAEPAAEHQSPAPDAAPQQAQHNGSSKVSPAPTGQPADLALPPPPLHLPRQLSLPGPPPPALPTVPASDPIGPLALPPLPAPEATSFSEAPCPPSDAPQAPKSPSGARSNKNLVKKESIRQRLEQAIANGEMPPYCNNCGAIETPTWRKIYVQERTGTPEFYEFSEKPGKVTAVIVLERDDEEKITKYQLIKKGLAPKEDKTNWKVLLLCNPCGIWLSKWKSHRPSEKWDKDQTRLQQSRQRKPGAAKPRSRSKKGGGQQGEAASEANLQTDPIGPSQQDNQSADELGSQSFNLGQDMGMELMSSREPSFGEENAPKLSDKGGDNDADLGTRAASMNDRAGDMGPARRLLFPSPRKDGVPKVLGNVEVNVVHSIHTQLPRNAKELAQGKENLAATTNGESAILDDDDDLEALFRSPIAARPSTPPPKAKSTTNTSQGPFKTPTRPTPSHRPITRSISRSVRSVRSGKSSGREGQPHATPSRTPSTNARLAPPESPSLRRSPRFQQHSEDPDMFLTPMTRSINQLLRAEDICPETDFNMDLSHMATVPASMYSANGRLDFAAIMGQDNLPSSPPLGRGVELDYMPDSSLWIEFPEHELDAEME